MCRYGRSALPATRTATTGRRDPGRFRRLGPAFVVYARGATPAFASSRALARCSSPEQDWAPIDEPMTDPARQALRFFLRRSNSPDPISAEPNPRAKTTNGPDPDHGSPVCGVVAPGTTTVGDVVVVVGVGVDDCADEEVAAIAWTFPELSV